MAITSKKIYKIDDKPVSPRELIDFASKVDFAFETLFVKTTSRAAAVLGSHGYSVTENADCEE